MNWGSSYQESDIRNHLNFVGIPSLQCDDNGEMFDHLSAFPLPVTDPLHFKNVTTLGGCRQMCKQLPNCSTAMISENTVCSIYLFDKLNRWTIQQNKESTLQTSTKLCWTSKLLSFPTVVLSLILKVIA